MHVEFHLGTPSTNIHRFRRVPGECSRLPPCEDLTGPVNIILTQKHLMKYRNTSNSFLSQRFYYQKKVSGEII